MNSRASSGWVKYLLTERYDKHREHLYRYDVRRRADVITTIIPFFRSHLMHSSKQRNFEKFAKCVELVDAGHHLTCVGLADIVEIAETMNRKKPRTDLLRILRGHTPNIQDTG
jgi:LAGLIDADG endonuclease